MGTIEIHFDPKDSEHYEYEYIIPEGMITEIKEGKIVYIIPEGMIAKIKEGKIVLKRKEIEDLRMIDILRYVVRKCATFDHALDFNGDLCENEYIEVDNWLRDLKDSIQTKNSK